MIRCVATSSILCALLAGCAVPDPGSKLYTEEVPTSFSTGRSGVPYSTSSNNWWTTLGDPRLNEIVTEAVGENPEVWQAIARTAQSRAQAVIAGADQLPSIGAGVNGQARRQANGSFKPSTTENYGVGLNIDWEIDLWGRLAAQSAAAREDYLASVDGLRAVRQSIAAQTAKSYFAVIEARQKASFSKQALDIQTETARQVSNRVDAGIGAPSDKFLAIANRESSTATLAGNEQAVEGATRQLELLLRDYPRGAVKTASQLAPVPPLPDTGIPASLLERRPDILAAERQLRASGFRFVSAKRSLLPAISLSGGVGTASNEVRDILNGDFSFWTLAGNLLQPIFQGGRLRANIALTEAVQREAAEAYVASVLQAFTEVESALATREKIARRIAALCRAADAAKSAERVSFNRYRQGVEPFLTVLESQQRALDTAIACISARRAGLDNYIDLHLALGGGFDEVAPALPTTLTLIEERFAGSTTTEVSQ